MRLLPALALLLACPALAQSGADTFPLRIQIAPGESARQTPVAVSWAPGAAEYKCAVDIAFGSGSRNGPYIALTPSDGGCTGAGPMPPPAQLRVVRFRTAEGTLILRMEGPPVNQGWEEGVAAARFRVEPSDGDERVGETEVYVWIGPEPLDEVFDDDIVRFNLGMPPAVGGINLGDLITK